MQDKKTIFIVDDDPSVRKALKRCIESVGLRVLTFASAQEFLDHISEDTKGCVILDIRMPGMNGLKLQEKLAEMEYELPIIFITAYDNPQDRKQAMEAGAEAFLRKPFDDQALLDAINSACEKSQPPL